MDLFYEENTGYLFAAQGKTGFQIWDVSDPYIPTKLGFWDEASQVIFVSGSNAYVGAGHDSSLYIVDVSDPAQPVQVGLCTAPEHIYGMFVAEPYCYVATGNGLSIIDVDSPTNPFEAGFLASPTFGTTYDVFVLDSLAYISQGSQGAGLQIADVSDPADPVALGHCETYSSEALFVIDSIAYLAANDGLHIIDVSSPYNPYQLGFQSMPEKAEAVYAYDAWSYVAAGEAGLKIVDVSDAANPHEVSDFDVPGEANDIIVIDSLAFITDRFGLRIIDVSNPPVSHEVASCALNGEGYRFCIRDSLLCVVTSDSMFCVLDIGDHSDPQIIGSCTIADLIFDVAVCDSYAYVISYTTVYIIDISVPSDPHLVGEERFSLDQTNIEIVDRSGYAYVTAYNGFAVLSIMTAPEISLVAEYPTYGFPLDVSFCRSHACVADWYGISIIDISNPENPFEVSYLSTTDTERISTTTYYAYIQDCYQRRVRAFDVSVPLNPHEVGYMSMAAYGGDLYAKDSIIYSVDEGIQMYENVLENISAPQISVDPQAFSVVLEVGGQTTEELSIVNRGNVGLEWFTVWSDEYWFDIDPYGGIIAPGESTLVSVFFEGVDLGTHYDTLTMCCDDPAAPFVDIYLKMEVYSRDSIFVYPNPGVARRGTALLIFSNVPAGAEVEIFDVSGRRIWKHVFTEGVRDYCWNCRAINGEEIAHGVYFYHITDGSGETVKKGKFSVVR